MSTSILVWFGAGGAFFIIAGIALAASGWLATPPPLGESALEPAASHTLASQAGARESRRAEPVRGGEDFPLARALVLWSPVAAAIAMALGLLCMTVGGYRAMRHTKGGVGRHAPFIFGLGVLMCAVGGVGILGVAGLIHNGQLDRKPTAAAGLDPSSHTEAAIAGPLASGSDDEHRRARFVMLAAAMAFIGSFLFTALSLWRKQDGEDHPEELDIGKLVAGGAMRSGQSLLFVLVFVLLTQVQQDVVLDGWLPVVGLMLGMFTKSGERVIYGISRRTFEMFGTALALPSRRDGGSSEDEGEEPRDRSEDPPTSGDADGPSKR